MSEKLAESRESLTRLTNHELLTRHVGNQCLQSSPFLQLGVTIKCDLDSNKH